TGTHSNFGRLLGDGLVREDADPELSLALQVAGDRDARRLDLATGHGATRKGLQAEFPEGEGVAALGISSAGPLLGLAVLGACGSESHGNCGFWITDCGLDRACGSGSFRNP